MLTALTLAALMATVSPGPKAATDTEPELDVVTLANGRSRKGRVVYVGDDTVVLKVKSRYQELERAEVEDIEALSLELPGALDEVARLRAGSAADHHDLVESLLARNLLREARLVDWLVLSFDAQNDVSNKRLGHRKRKKSWTVPHSRRHYKLEDRSALLGDWGDAWEFESTHFRVRTNLPLSTALHATFDLERTYRGFYQLFGAQLELWEITEPIDVHIHADASSFPESLGAGRSYFSRAGRVLVVNASRGLALGPMVHEATHALLFFSAVNTRAGRGDLPGWLNEGLAEYVEASLSGAFGAIDFYFGKPNQGHFASHSSAKKPYRLNRVLNFQNNDFAGTSKTLLKYAQSYSLVHYLLHGESGRHREGFLHYLRQVYEGKSSSTHFKKSFEVREKELEEGWHAYAQEAREDH